MTKKIFLTGASSGIGQACYDILSNDYQIIAPTKEEFNLNNFEIINSIDLSDYDIVINCAGTNVGTYLGFHNNDYINQIDQINVNFIAPLLLVKQYTRVRTHGHFIYCSSASIRNPFLYNIVNCSAKMALKFSIDVMRTNIPEFTFTEICPGKTKTNMLKRNYNGTKTDIQIEAEYNEQLFLHPSDVAKSIAYAIDKKIDEIVLTPK